MKKYPTRVTDIEFDIYGEKLVELTSHIVSIDPHCSLGPLRGAAKPCVMVEVMSRGAREYDYFNFQGNSNAATHPRIISDLKEILIRRDPEEELYRINITDAARGGNGINNLVSLMARVKQDVPQFRKQLWVLDLNLVHDKATKDHVARIESVRNRRESNFEICLNRYTVPNLIVEDFDPALAFQMEWDGQRHAFKPCSQAGQFLYQVGNEVHLVASENCYLTFEELYSKAIMDALVNSPRHELDAVVWQEYEVK